MADQQDTRAHKQPPQTGWPPAASYYWRWDTGPGGAAVRLRGLAVLRYPCRSWRGCFARSPALLGTEGKDDHLPLLQEKKSQRRGRLPLHFREGGYGGSRFIWEDL